MLIEVIMRFTFVKGNKLKRNRIIPIVENTQIPIFKFEYLQSESNNLESGSTG
jgi:hypothetical protein